MLPLEEDVDNTWYDQLCNYAQVFPEAGILGSKLLYPAKHKDKFINDSKSDGRDNIPLIYPRNLKNGKITFIKDDKKPQYIKYNVDIKPIFGPVIAINRIVGLDSVSLHPVLIETGKYFFENHINVITGDMNNLIMIEKSLSSSKTIEKHYLIHSPTYLRNTLSPLKQ